MNRQGDRAQRGQRQEHGGAGGGGQQRGGGDQQNSGNNEQKRDRPKKESIIDLSKFVDKQVRVKFQGGREATGKLKGYDHLLNLVLDDTIEYLRDGEDSSQISDKTRSLGLVVCRGPAVTVVCPQEGHEAIQNPFVSE